MEIYHNQSLLSQRILSLLQCMFKILFLVQYQYLVAYQSKNVSYLTRLIPVHKSSIRRIFLGSAYSWGS